METPDTAWRQTNVGRLLNNAVRRFEERVFAILADGGHSPARLSHLGLTRHLDLEGTRITELARRAAMTKQAMAELVVQCEAAGIVSRTDDPGDRRAKIVRFSDQGLRWLAAFREAILLAESEMSAELGDRRVAELTETLRRYGA